MKTIGEIRRDNLLALLAKYGSLAALNEQLHRVRTDATLSQIKNGNATSRGKPKMMGNALARRIELALDLGPGWMDNDHAPDSARQNQINHALVIMERMDEWQLGQTVAIINTLAAGAPIPEPEDQVLPNAIEAEQALRAMGKRADAKNHARQSNASKVKRNAA